MNNVKAVIFDLDNTILDRSKTFRNFAASFVQTYFGHLETADGLTERIIELDQDGYKERTALFGELLDELPWKDKPGLNELMAFYRLHYVLNAALMDQAEEVLRVLKSKYRVGLITNGKTDIQYGKIDQLGIRHMFECILVSEEAGVKKPDSRIFEMAVARLKVRPDECVYVGDHPRNDIEGAGKSGMRTVWIKVNQPWIPELTVRPYHKIERLPELLALL
jgi:haloacid dehalogenase superfamily, subfamily IA, variant 3 with third motif having DD or ED/haloacid dehalogenase superfamily, subfamily IA, variant 1 with third motif having Dx(3-4)D or Dx(3-4)E